MAEILNAKIVLRLNSGYLRIGWATVAEAVTAMTGGNTEAPPALALDIEYERDENGAPIFDKMASAYAKPWEDWIEVPVREYDMSIRTPRLVIRVPTVIVCPKFHKMPVKQRLRPTSRDIRERDGNRCQYTGKELTNKTFTLDHLVPRSKGGGDTWENLVSCHRDINSKKGNKLNEEAGLTVLRKPFAPKPIPLCQLIDGNKHPDHSFF